MVYKWGCYYLLRLCISYRKSIHIHDKVVGFFIFLKMVILYWANLLNYCYDFVYMSVLIILPWLVLFVINWEYNWSIWLYSIGVYLCFKWGLCFFRGKLYFIMIIILLLLLLLWEEYISLKTNFWIAILCFC